ncbi:hypothetical protein TRAPUB_5040 [Trametes pubescens]|uniref:Uncharacterized protein n=1 Tax=Trametes pubescens TaxID=154538 RepID=A0A1M2V9A9_TRAPU|nr:hypothetical protein TRAPUB_5040 [Trametes pubescens]
MSNFRLFPFIPDEVPYRADGSVDRERLPQGTNLVMDDITEWFIHCEATCWSNREFVGRSKKNE